MLEWVFKLNGFPVRKAERIWQKVQAMEDATFQQWREKQKWDIFKFHLSHTPLYKDKLGGNLPRVWNEIPPMRKSDFQQPLAELVSDAYSLRDLYIGNTSGSSGHPFYYAKDKLAHALTWANIKALYASHGLHSRSLQARFYGIPLKGKSRKIEQLKDFVLHRVRFPVFDLSETVLSQWVEKFRNHRFAYLYGYTSSLVYFARYCIKRGVLLKEVCPTLQLCMVTSEVCTPEDRRILEEGFGARVVNEYGASEVGLIAFEHPSNQWGLCEELLYIEAVDETGCPVPDGTTGRLLISSLFNKAMPFIRYEIGDVGVLGSLPSGRKRLVSLEGRTNDFVILPSGKTAPGLTFYYIARSLLEESSFIKEFVIRQPAVDVLEFVVVAERPLNENEQILVQQKMDEYLEPGLKLKIIQVDKIERPDGSGGKIKHFYSCIEKQDT